MAEVVDGGPRLPEDLVVWEILTRLPVKPLLRCRAVCRSWRHRLTHDAKFLLAHHRRQPSLPLLTAWDADTHERRVDALDHRTGERLPVARTPGQTAAASASPESESEDGLHVLASCDGLVILRAYGGLEICNPATRQRAPLALLRGAACISALYPHRPSGSYRVLCGYNRAEDGHGVYQVHTVGSGELRCIGEPPGPWASGDPTMAVGFLDPPVLADGRIYWQPYQLPDGNDDDKVNNMLAFDTIAESFQHLLSPLDVEGPYVELFQMNSGALGLYHYSVRTADLWVLQDHRSWSWSMNHRIKLDVLFFDLLPVLDPEGDVLVRSIRRESPGILRQHLWDISGADGSWLARYEWSIYLKLSSHRFKESLVHHEFFSMEGNAGGMDEKPLFDGLSTVALVRVENSERH